MLIIPDINNSLFSAIINCNAKLVGEIPTVKFFKKGGDSLVKMELSVIKII